MKTTSSPRRMKSIPLGRPVLYKEGRGTPARGHFKFRALNPNRKRSIPPAAPAGTRAPPACPGTRLASAWPAAPHARGRPALVAAGRPFSTACGVYPVAHALPPAVPPARRRGSGGTLAQPAPPDGGGPCGLGVGAGQPAPLKGGRWTNRGDVTQRLKNAVRSPGVRWRGG